MHRYYDIGIRLVDPIAARANECRHYILLANHVFYRGQLLDKFITLMSGCIASDQNRKERYNRLVRLLLKVNNQHGT